MLRFLSINNPSWLLNAVVASFVLHVIYFFSGKIDYAFVLSYDEPVSKALFGMLVEAGDLFFLILLLGGSVLQILGAIIINQIINEFKLSSRRAYLGALLYVLATSLHPSWLILSPPLIALTVWLILFQRIMTLSKQEKFYGALFDVGFLCTFSAFVYAPSVFYIVFLLPALYSVRAFQFKEFLRVLIGFTTPIYVIVTLYFINDKLPELLTDMSNWSNLTILSIESFRKNFSPFIYLILIWLPISGFAFAMMPASLPLKTRNVSTLLIFHTVLVAMFFFIPTHFHLAYFILAVPIIPIYLCLYFLESKSQFLPNVIFALLSVFTLLPLIF